VKKIKGLGSSIYWSILVPSMIDAIGAYRPNLPAPSYHEIRVPLLNREVEYIEKLLQDHKLQ